MKSPLISIIVPQMSSNVRECASLIRTIKAADCPVEVFLIRPETDVPPHGPNALKKAGVKHTICYEKRFDIATFRMYISQKCQGKYIAVLSPTDVFEPDFLFRMVHRAERARADITFCDFLRFDTKSKTRQAVAWSLVQSRLPSKPVFSAADCPLTVFNITPLGLFNKLYKRSFLQSIPYEISENVSGFVAFGLETFTMAERIAYVEGRLWCSCPRPHLPQKDIDSERSVVQEFGDVCYFLMKTQKQVLLHQSFVNYFVQKLYLMSQVLAEPQKSFWQSFVATRCLRYFHTDTYDATYFYHWEHYPWVHALLLKPNLSDRLEDMYRRNKKNVIPIVMAINDHYTDYAGVTIQSIREHASPDYFYDIYIMYTGLSDESIKRLENLSESHVRITCMNVSENLADCTLEDKLNKDLWHISKETFYRFLIADLFPGYDKVLYLDCDLVVLSDVAELYQTDLGTNLLGGCYNSLYDEEYRYAENTLKTDSLSYINAGVLLINTKLWRKEKVQEQCFDVLAQYGNTLKYQDQDILNMVCRYRICLLPYHWNFIYSLYTMQNPGYMRYLDRQAFRVCDLKIIHYTWWRKPWNCPEAQWADIWWAYAKRSPFYEHILFNRVAGMERKYVKTDVPASRLIKSDSSVSERLKGIRTVSPDVDPLLKQYIKEAVLFLLSWGHTRQYHRNNLDMLMRLIEQR